MTNENILYLGTIFMLFIAMIFIAFIVWATITIYKFKLFSQDRDKTYMERITAMESLIKKEFLGVINSIKNL